MDNGQHQRGTPTNPSTPSTPSIPTPAPAPASRPRFSTRAGRTKVVVISAAALLAAAGGITYALLPKDRGEGDAASGIQVTKAPDLAQARLTSFDISTIAVGELEARRNVEVRSPLEDSATITQIVDEGTLVRAGQVLIQLNADPIKTRVDEETLRVESGRAEFIAAKNAYDIQVNENSSRLRDAQLKVELARLALRQWEEGDLKKKRQSLDLEISRATLELDRLAEKLRNSDEVFAAGYMSKDERDRDEVLYIQAIAAYKDAYLARNVYENYELIAERKQKVSDVQTAIDELARVRLDNEIELASKLAELNNRRTSLSILENKLEKLRTQLAAATIIAPQDGLVVYATSLERGGWGNRSEGPLQIGQQVFPNQLLMLLPDTSAMIASVRVQESLAGRVRPGQRASVKIDAAGGKTFEGVVDSIGVMAETGGWRDPNLREYTVRVAVDAQGVDLKPAMRAEAVITLGSVTDAVAIPVQAVFNDGPVQFVHVPRGNRFARLPVSLGRRSDTLAEVRAGLSPGDTVLLRAPTPGEIVREPWTQAQLTLAGYTTTPEGQVVPTAGPPGGRPNAPARGPGRPGGERRPSPDGAQGDAAPTPKADTPITRGPTADAATPSPAPDAAAQPNATTAAAPSTPDARTETK